MRALVVPEWVLWVAAAYALVSTITSTLLILQSRREIALNRELVQVLKGRSREATAIGPLTTLPEITAAVSAISRDLGVVLGELETRCGLRWVEESTLPEIPARVSVPPVRPPREEESNG